MKVTDELLAIFEAEAAEQLERMAVELARAPAEWDITALFTISHNLKGAAGFVDATAMADTAHALEELFSLVRKGTPRDEALADLARVGGRILQQTTGPATPSLLQEIDAYRAEVEEYCESREAEVEGGDAGESASRELPAQRGRASRQREPAAEAAPPAGPAVAGQPSAPESPGAVGGGGHYTLRVGVEKLDRLMDLAGELHATRFALEDLQGRMSALITQLVELERRGLHAGQGADLGRLTGTGFGLRREFARITGRYETTVAQVQDSVRLLRMVPLNSAEGLLKKLVRDTCQETGREARFGIEGAETEIDRVVLDRLRDPLVHLLRNAVVHGIEPPADRLAAGKPREGRIELRARTAGAWIEITVTDDGRGINEADVRRRALERGLITGQQAETLGRAELFDLIFQPGFSTVEEVNQIAGRGVGLDIVRRNLIAVGGAVSVHRRALQGTEFRIRIPLTRLTTRGVLVRIGGRFFAISIEAIERTASWEPGAGPVADGQELVDIDGELVPVTMLAEALDLPAEAAPRKTVVVLCHGGQRRAFAVDEMIGERDFLLQPLPWNVQGVQGIMGAAIMTGGDTVLILDSEALLAGRSKRRSQRSATDAGAAERARRVLVVDDSVTSRTLQKIILSSAGFDVLLAVDGAEAWRLIEDGELIDLVITDIEMPEVDGIELTRRIRSRAESLPVILVTSLGKEEDRRAGAEAGADAYIVKGAFDQDELLAAVARLL